MVLGSCMIDDQADAAADLALVRGALQREAKAVEALAIRLGCVPRIVACLNQKVGRPLADHDLADVAQDIVGRVLERLSDYEGRAAFEGWVFRFCSYELMNAIRRRRRQPPAAGEFDEPPDVAHALAWRQRQQREELEDALARIGGAEAEAVRLRHFDGLNNTEIAARQRTTIGAVKARYQRGMTRLKTLFHLQGEEIHRDQVE